MNSNFLFKHKKISKILYKLSTLFVFSDSKRRKIKHDFFSTITKNQINQLQNKYKDYWIFELFFPTGDLGIAVALMKEFKKRNGGKILLLICDDNRKKIIESFPAVDKVLTIDSRIYNYIFQNPNIEIIKGKYFELNHWKFIDAPLYKSNNFLELYKNMLGITGDYELEKPIFSDVIIGNVEKYCDNNKIMLENTIVLTPEANSFDCNDIDSDFWINIANKLKDFGYDVYFNCNQQKYGKNQKYIFLPMLEQLYFCSKCARTIGLRAGINDLLAIFGIDNMTIIYPQNMFFNTISNHQQLLEFKRAFNWEYENSISDNMYKITSLTMFNLPRIKEIRNLDNTDLFNDIMSELQK